MSQCTEIPGCDGQECCFRRRQQESQATTAREETWDWDAG